MDMGTGASAQAASAVQSASVEGLQEALDQMPEEQRAKIQSAMALAASKAHEKISCMALDHISTLLLCTGSGPPEPMKLAVGFDLIASGMWSTVVRCTDGTLWRLHDGCESSGCEKLEVSADVVQKLQYLSVHDGTIFGLTKDSCYALSPLEPEEAKAYGSDSAAEAGDLIDPPLHLDTLAGHGLVQVVGHCPEDWLLGRTAAGDVLAFGPSIANRSDGGGKVRKLELPGPSAQVSMSGSQFGLALLEDGRVFMIGGSNSQYQGAACLDEIDALMVTHIKELDDKGISCIAAGREHSVAVTEAGAIFTWGTCNLYETDPVKGEDLPEPYLGSLYRKADNCEEAGPQKEYGGIPALARLPPGFGETPVKLAICSPVGEIFLLLRDARVVRAALGADLKADSSLWGSACKISVFPHRSTFIAQVAISAAKLQEATEACKRHKEAEVQLARRDEEDEESEDAE